MTGSEVRQLKKWYEEYETIKAYKESLERGEQIVTINTNVFSIRHGLIQLCDRQLGAIKDMLCNFTGTETSMEDFERKK